MNRYGTGSFICALFSLLLYVSCERPPEIPSPESMEPVSVVPEMDDDIFPEGLKEAIGSSVETLSKKKDHSLRFGRREVSGRDYALSLAHLLEKLEEGATREAFMEEIRRNFDLYGFPGKPEGRILVTSYFSPVLSASEKRTPMHSQPLYRAPGDLVKVRMDRFFGEFERFSFMEDDRVARAKFGSLFGRVVSAGEGRPPELVPYYSRREIDSGRRLAGRNLEIAWVDSVDAFFLHVQGSGKIRFSDGKEISVGYSAQNGHDYVAIGKFLFDVIPEEKMSLWAIENHLRSLSYPEMRKILYENPSYIFFRELRGKPRASFGTEVVDGRTVATDDVFFPRGAVGFMEFEAPVFDGPAAAEPSGWKPVSRMVANHDAGGAIKGPRRVDLFWGEGKDASRHAGVMKNWGRLFCLVPRAEFLEKLRAKTPRERGGLENPDD